MFFLTVVVLPETLQNCLNGARTGAFNKVFVKMVLVLQTTHNRIFTLDLLRCVQD